MESTYQMCVIECEHVLESEGSLEEVELRLSMNSRVVGNVFFSVIVRKSEEMLENKKRINCLCLSRCHMSKTLLYAAISEQKCLKCVLFICYKLCVRSY